MQVWQCSTCKISNKTRHRCPAAPTEAALSCDTVILCPSELVHCVSRPYFVQELQQLLISQELLGCHIALCYLYALF